MQNELNLRCTNQATYKVLGNSMLDLQDIKMLLSPQSIPIGWDDRWSEALGSCFDGAWALPSISAVKSLFKTVKPVSRKDHNVLKAADSILSSCEQMVRTQVCVDLSLFVLMVTKDAPLDGWEMAAANIDEICLGVTGNKGLPPFVGENMAAIRKWLSDIEAKAPLEVVREIPTMRRSLDDAGVLLKLIS